MNNITRRQIVAIALGSGVAGSAMASPQAAPDFLQAARDSKQAAADILGKFELPMSVEPAFQFKA